jgi:hypothetical protein
LKRKLTFFSIKISETRREVVKPEVLTKLLTSRIGQCLKSVAVKRLKEDVTCKGSLNESCNELLDSTNVVEFLER